VNNDLSALDTALALLACGRWPVALHPGQKRPIGDAWGLTRPTEASLRETFRTHPGAGVGLILGPEAGIVDLEIDGDEGVQSILKLMGGTPPPTLGNLSRRGPHRFYKYDPRLAALANGSGVIKLTSLPGLEIRLGAPGRQLQSAVPPTTTDSYTRRWVGPDDIAPLPEAAIEFLTAALASPIPATPSPSNGRVLVVAAPTDPARAWFVKALENQAGKGATARDGTRHGTLYDAARALGGMIHHGHLTEADVVAELTHAGQRAGLPDQEVAETIRDGMVTGAAAPLPWPDKLARPGATITATNGRHEPGYDAPLPPSPDTRNSGRQPVGDEAESETQAQILLRLAAVADLTHTDGGRAYARVPVGDHHENHEVRSPGFKKWLTHAFYREKSRPPSTDAMQGALSVLEAQAQFDGATEPVHVRVAPGVGSLFIDLGDDSWRVLQVGPGTWGVVDRPPVRFRRSSGLRPLPRPERGGSIHALRRYANVAERDFLLLVAWLTAALQSTGPYPALVLSGEQGSAKSTLAKLLRRLADPHVSLLRSEPKEPRDLAIAATNGWVIAFDNLSSLPNWLSDALCRLATGGGFSTRQLYTDSEEMHFDATRPVILTGIEDYIRRGDLADRCVFLHLPAIPEAGRRTEAEFWKAFDADAPILFGAVVSALAEGLRLLPTVRLDRLPRMADFAKWGEAVCRSQGWEPGAFLAAYERNRRDAHEAALEDSLVATAVRSLMTGRDAWEGTARELLDDLTGRLPDPSAPAVKYRWPRSPRGLSGHLRRDAPALRAIGIDVAFGRGKDRRIFIGTVKAGEQPTQPTQPAADHLPVDGGDCRDGRFPSFSGPEPDGRGKVESAACPGTAPDKEGGEWI
jgi:hypothetical protein